MACSTKSDSSSRVESVSAFDTSWGRAAMLVCEDAWHALAPTLAALDGAQVILVPSATPARGLMPRPGISRPANLDRWDRLAQGIAEEHGVYVLVSHLVGFEGGKGFAGGSIAAGPRGDLLVHAPLFEPATVPVAIDLDEITRARADSPLLSDLKSRLPHLLESLSGRTGGQADGTDGRRTGETDTALEPPPSARPPVRPSAGDALAIDPELSRKWLVEFIKDEIIRRRKFGRGSDRALRRSRQCPRDLSSGRSARSR